MVKIFSLFFFYDVSYKFIFHLHPAKDSGPNFVHSVPNLRKTCIPVQTTHTYIGGKVQRNPYGHILHTLEWLEGQIRHMKERDAAIVKD